MPWVEVRMEFVKPVSMSVITVRRISPLRFQAPNGVWGARASTWAVSPRSSCIMRLFWEAPLWMPTTTAGTWPPQHHITGKGREEVPSPWPPAALDIAFPVLPLQADTCLPQPTLVIEREFDTYTAAVARVVGCNHKSIHKQGNLIACGQCDEPCPHTRGSMR